MSFYKSKIMHIKNTNNDSLKIIEFALILVQSILCQGYLIEQWYLIEVDFNLNHSLRVSISSTLSRRILPPSQRHALPKMPQRKDS